MAFGIAGLLLIAFRLMAVSGAQLNCRECANYCATEFAGNFSRAVFDADIPQGTLPTLNLLLNAASRLQAANESAHAFVRLCDVHMDYEHCIRNCTECEFQKVILQSTTPVRYLCTKRLSVYLENMDCYTKHYHDFHMNCSHDLTRLSNTTSQLAHVTSLPLTLRPTIVKQYCSTMSQYLKCYIPSVDHWCGENASMLMDDLLSVALSKIRMFTGNQELRSPIPKECKELFLRIPNLDEAYEGHNDTLHHFRHDPFGLNGTDIADIGDSGVRSSVSSSICLLMLLFVFLLWN